VRVLDDILMGAVADGDLPRSLQADAAVAQLVGPVLFRYLFEDDHALDHDYVVSVVDWFLGATRAS
jgi:hypothetical protein